MRQRMFVLGSVILSLLSACGGGGSGGGSTPPAPTYSVGGSIAGLGGTVVLQNGSDTLSIAQNGTFTFPTPLKAGQAYSVSVKTQPDPPSQTCSITQSTGTVDSTNVTNVAVECVTNTFAVGGAVSGLTGSGLVLEQNGADDLAISANGSFRFTTAVASGQAYSITVKTQPANPAQTCVVTAGSGTVGDSPVTNAQVACTTDGNGGSTPPPSTYSVGGSVTGLAGTVVLQNGSDTLSVAQDGIFKFPTALKAGDTYNVTVKTQPNTPSQTCSITKGAGTVGNANITSVAVACVTNTFPVGGSVSGLTGGNLVLEQNGGDDLSISASGSFQFATAVASGHAYDVTVKTQPNNPSQTCSVTAGNGTVTDAAIIAVRVTCVVNTFTIGGSITGLSGTGLVLEDNSGDDLAVAAHSNSFKFATKVASGKTYHVTVKTQPTSPAQSCVVTGGTGTVGGTAIGNVQVACTTSAVACGTENGTVVTHADAIMANETWAGAGTVHLIPNDITIYAPAALTIEPCAIVKLGSGVQVTIRGDALHTKSAQLIAAGNDPVNGVVFFTAADASQPWARLESVDLSSYIELDNVSIKNGGAVGGAEHNAVIYASGGSAQLGGSVHPDPVLKVMNATFDSNGGMAIYLGSNSRFTDDSTNLVVEHGGDYPVGMWAMALGSVPTATFTQNTTNNLLVLETFDIYDDLTISTTIPIDFNASVWVIADGQYGVDKQDITLTLNAGVTWRFLNTNSESDLLSFGSDETHVGTLIANGTAAEPVTFTSSSQTPAPGDWAGIWLEAADGSQLNHVIVEYAGAAAGLELTDCAPPDGNDAWPNTAAIIVGNNDSGYVPPSNLITNSILRNNGGSFAIDATWTAPSFGPDLTQTNTITASSKACTQPRNVLPGNHCDVNGQDERGCLVP